MNWHNDLDQLVSSFYLNRIVTSIICMNYALIHLELNER